MWWLIYPKLAGTCFLQHKLTVSPVSGVDVKILGAMLDAGTRFVDFINTPVILTSNDTFIPLTGKLVAVFFEAPDVAVTCREKGNQSLICPLRLACVLATRKFSETVDELIIVFSPAFLHLMAVLLCSHKESLYVTQSCLTRGTAP